MRDAQETTDSLEEVWTGFIQENQSFCLLFKRFTILIYKSSFSQRASDTHNNFNFILKSAQVRSPDSVNKGTGGSVSGNGV